MAGTTISRFSILLFAAFAIATTLMANAAKGWAASEIGFGPVANISATVSTPLSDEKHRAAVEEFSETSFFAKGHGMHMSPGLITHFNDVMSKAPAPNNPNLDLRTYFTRRWGLNFKDQFLLGVFDREYEGLNVGVIGCVACHSGKAAGQMIVGLGNKNIDVFQMADDVYRLETWWKKIVPKRAKSEAYVDVEENALQFIQYLADENLGNLSQGLVPISFIRGWFYRVHGENVPQSLNRGQAKIPALWGYEKKREVGLFCDGYGDGQELGWAVAVELAAGQRPEVIRELYEDVRHTEELFNEFLPPKYPFEIDQVLAEKGHTLFNNTCAKCHGTYERDSSGYPIYKSPKHIPWHVVQTDKDRLLGNTAEFAKKVDESPLSDIIRYTDLGEGYFAPRLEGVWSRFPYLHNASVPNVKALLTKPEDRPVVFSLKNSGERHRFDSSALGLTVPDSFVEKMKHEFKAGSGDRSVYWTHREGHSNQGHDFYTNISESDKTLIIEYLKTL